jgi:hypothetical protein
VDYLLDLTEEVLPLGNRAWKHIEAEHNKWATLHGRPQRTVKSLETKYKQVSRVLLSTTHCLILDSLRKPKNLQDVQRSHLTFYVLTISRT